VTKKLDLRRILNSDECPNPLDGNPSGARKTPVLGSFASHSSRLTHAVVRGADGKWRRPQKLGGEHSQNVTVDPIVSMAGEMYNVQVIFKGDSVDESMLFSADFPGMASASENVRSILLLWSNSSRDGKHKLRFKKGCKSSTRSSLRVVLQGL
jgi:hypothetical protein